MTKVSRFLITPSFLGVLLAACAPMSPHLDASFGEAAKSATARQVLDPGARDANAARDAPGIDGKAAKAIGDRYYRSFAYPESQPNVLTIGVGGGTASTGAR